MFAYKFKIRKHSLCRWKFIYTIVAECIRARKHTHWSCTHKLYTHNNQFSGFFASVVWVCIFIWKCCEMPSHHKMFVLSVSLSLVANLHCTMINCECNPKQHTHSISRKPEKRGHPSNKFFNKMFYGRGSGFDCGCCCCFCTMNCIHWIEIKFAGPFIFRLVFGVTTI